MTVKTARTATTTRATAIGSARPRTKATTGGRKVAKKADAQQLAWTSGSTAGPPHAWSQGPGQGAGHGRAAPETVTLNRAREELGLDFSLFELALQLGEIRTVPRGAGQWRVPVDEVTRLRDAPGHPQALLDRLALVTSTEGAALMGVSRDRLVRLARLGMIRPVRWYINRYRALVWVYLGHELREFAAASPALLEGRLPAGLRATLDAGEDQRARGWRSRRVAQLVRDCHDAWEEAAVWAALLGPEATDDAVPDPLERARLRGIRAALPPGRPGALATPEVITNLTTADDPDEIALALVALADALGRARAEQPVPRPAFVPECRAPQSRALEDRALEDRAPVDRLLEDRTPESRMPASRTPEAAGPADRVPAGVRGGPPPRPPRPPRRGLLGRLRGRRSAADLAEQPFLHDRDQKVPAPVEDLTARQTAGAGRDR
ncbi:DUF6397 family protein [Actinacidiphila alni]|uniref:DUF6397 family protein n=1 Tax=Actinacidiphila alni TaxID=380248 RepID=UPI0033E604AA